MVQALVGIDGKWVYASNKGLSSAKTTEARRNSAMATVITRRDVNAMPTGPKRTLKELDDKLYAFVSSPDSMEKPINPSKMGFHFFITKESDAISERKIVYIDEFEGELWLGVDGNSIVGVVRSPTQLAALTAMENEILEHVKPEKLYEAYGFSNKYVFEQHARVGNRMSLAPGYTSVAVPGGGSVVVKHSINGYGVCPLTPRMMVDYNIEMRVVFN